LLSGAKDLIVRATAGLSNTSARNYGTYFNLPERSSIGANCRANARGFLSPCAQTKRCSAKKNGRRIRNQHTLAACPRQHDVSSARSTIKTLGEKKAASADRIRGT
jgi:hypothetical protein